MESILAVAQAAIGDVSTDENRSKNFGLIGAAFGLGFILGPYIGGRLSAPGVSFYHLFTTPRWFGATTPFWFAAALAATNATFVFFTLAETLTTRRTGRLNVAASVNNVRAGFTYSSVSSLAQVPASILVGYIAGSLTSTAPLIAASMLTVVAGVRFIARFRPTFVGTSTFPVNATPH